MKIIVDEKEIEISKELIHLISLTSQPEFKRIYDGFEPRIRLGIKTAIRTFIFPWIERKTGIAMRPEKHVDPLFYLIDLFSGIVEELSEYAAINLKTVNASGQTYSPTAFNFTLSNPSESGRQLAFSWQEGQRQNSILEDLAKPSD